MRLRCAGWTSTRAFLAAAGTGRFHLAAADLALTQQAVSKRIGVLERELGVRLFVRTPRGVELTGDGQAFLPPAWAGAAGAGAGRAAGVADPARR